MIFNFHKLINCALLCLITNSVFSQPSNDPTWDPTPVFIDDFSTSGRSWDANWFDSPLYKWRGYMAATGPYHGYNYEWQVFQPQMLNFSSSNGVLKITTSEQDGPMGCDDYIVPPGYNCDPTFPNLYCYSGAIESLNPSQFLFGYFEIRCKMPTHKGAFPAFWLYAESDGEYREIDIFEYSSSFSGDDRRTTTRQIYYKSADETESTTYAHLYHTMNEALNESDLSDWHTFGLEWSPDRIVYYVDGKNIGSFTGYGIPNKPMGLIVNYSVDNYIATPAPRVWNPPSDFPSEMIVDYVLVKKLRVNCSEDILIYNDSHLADFDGGYKRSILMEGQTENVNISNFTNGVFRAGTIELRGDVEVPIGKEVEFITHPCPL